MLNSTQISRNFVPPTLRPETNPPRVENRPRAQQVQTGFVDLGQPGRPETAIQGFAIAGSSGNGIHVLAFDFDKNGSISGQEVTKSLRVLASFSDPNPSTRQNPELSALRGQLDPNGDGVLNQQELKNSEAFLLHSGSDNFRHAVSEGFRASPADAREGGRDILLDVNLKNGNASVANVELGFENMHSFIQEPSVSKVARAFPLLGRQPTQGDYDFWSEQLDSGRATETTMLASFLEASGRDDRDIVNQLYRTVLGEEPNTTPAGADAWVSALEGGLPVSVIVQGFINIRDQQRRGL